MAQPTKPKSTNDGYDYIVSAAYQKKDVLTILNKQHVNVTGGVIEKETKATKLAAPRKYSYKGTDPEIRKQFWWNAVLRDKQGNPITDASGEPISKQKAIIRIKNVSTDTTSDQ